MTRVPCCDASDRDRFELALAGTRLGLWDWDMQTGETTFNERWAAIVGYTLAELSPTTIDTWAALAHPDDLALSAAAIESHTRGDAPFYDVEVRMRHRTGGWVWVHDRGQIVEWTEDGQPHRMIGTHEDITDRVTAQQDLAASERRATAMFRDHEAVMLLIDAEDGRIVDANQAAAHFYGYTSDQLRSMNIDQINLLPAEEVARRRQQALERSRESFVFPHRLADGRSRLVEVHSSPIEDHGRILLYSIIRDVTEREKYEKSQRQAAAVFEHISDAVIISDNRGVILQVNPACTRVTGWTGASLIGQDTRILASPISDPDHRSAVRENHRSMKGFHSEMSLRHADGSDFPCLVSASPIAGPMGEVDGFVTLVTDIRERVRAEEDHLSFVTRHDPVTGLPNRLWFTEMLDVRLGQLRGSGRTSTLLLIDLDRFQAINDSFGRQTGDVVLATMAGRLASTLRPDDVLASVHGNEFGIMLDGVSQASEALLTAERLLAEIAIAIPVPQQTELRLSACIGVKLIPGSSPTAELAMQNAEAALHEAKRIGPGTIRRHSEHLIPASRDRVTLETRLWHAWEAREFTVAYQPQVDLVSRTVVGAEALLRWTPPGGGPIPPDRFIPVAEEIGLITDLGRWVLHETCRQGSEWLARHGRSLTLAVNVAAAQFAHGSLARDVDRILGATGFPAELLELELTESGLLGAADETIAELHAIRSRGVRLSIDDFGTGFSSLSYLTRLPLTRLKIDKTFVAGLGRDPNASTVASTIVSMGHALGLEVLAEGVESEEQLAELGSYGCDLFQGFLHSRPIDADSFERLVAGSL